MALCHSIVRCRLELKCSEDDGYTVGGRWTTLCDPLARRRAGEAGVRLRPPLVCDDRGRALPGRCSILCCPIGTWFGPRRARAVHRRLPMARQWKPSAGVSRASENPTEGLWLRRCRRLTIWNQPMLAKHERRCRGPSCDLGGVNTSSAMTVVERVDEFIESKVYSTSGGLHLKA